MLNSQLHLDLEVCDKEILVEKLKEVLIPNPFVKAETIYHYIEEILNAELSEDFENYVTADDYYPPVAEDYGLTMKKSSINSVKIMALKSLI